MINYIASSLPVVAFVVLIIVLVFAGLVLYALRNKGDVFAELSHGKTTLRFDARDRRNTTRLR
jgi:hypothetical protein